MSPTINWEPSTNSLRAIHSAITGNEGEWPRPNIETSPITDEQRRRARRTWSDRVRGSYITAEWAASLSRQLLTLGAPLDLLTGASYVTQELMHQLTVATHLLDPLQPVKTLSVPDDLFSQCSGSGTWESVFDRTMELFVFDLALSQPIYEGLGAVSSDPAISELCIAVAESLDELIHFGELSLQWMSQELPTRVTASSQARLPALLAAYESICEGTPDTLDELAGKEITVETRPGNLGTLQSDHLAAIFYDTLNRSIFPFLDSLGWRGLKAWQRHYRHADHLQRRGAVVAAIGVRPLADARR